ncbi:YdiU family protein [Altererythrobacter sp. CC-YST694]|uniref:protein adenylyltransferase SelO family protein n=1 Tax=Altererythrobacter sp. CC-YST694 TaxID=2755038 RepID=UPI001D022E7B|nr:YdiU family protein [Altererythrobacter sp. CC-YST694]MCB5424029.1 YdiU family protein [Altererythrobacter sp. CC-YST694]
MRAEPPQAPYRPDPQILKLAEWLGDEVSPADFPKAELRFRNRRWDRAVGLEALSDEQWVRHFGHFEPLPGNLPRPLALRYHGHQFRVYNPEIGDGRGFTFAQLRDGPNYGQAPRLLDLGTKGSGLTPYSRTADGRLTLKGAVREILATEMLEALGTYTSKTFSVIETGEELWRGDEPSPTRSAVLVRLSHSHIRIGTFQRLAAFEAKAEMEQLIAYCLEQFPGPLPPEDAPGRSEPAVILFHQVVERLADLAASYVVAGFVHGVLNTDNMNITGESFDYGPWRWLPRWEPGFTAAYFDEQGLYAFGRQAEAIHWNCAQLAIALRQVCEAPPLVAALERFPALYHGAMARRFCWRLGVESHGVEEDMKLITVAEQTMREQSVAPDAFFFTHRGGRGANGDLAAVFAGRARLESGSEYWAESAPQAMLIEEVEAIWAAIAEHDDWAPLNAKVEALRRMGNALGEPPIPTGHRSFK